MMEADPSTLARGVEMLDLPPLSFDVDDIDSEVRELKDKGIMFEHYDMEGLTRDGDVYQGEGMKTAWFKDPDGNILSLIEA